MKGKKIATTKVVLYQRSMYMYMIRNLPTQAPVISGYASHDGISQCRLTPTRLLFSCICWAQLLPCVLGDSYLLSGFANMWCAGVVVLYADRSRHYPRYAEVCRASDVLESPALPSKIFLSPSKFYLMSTSTVFPRLSVAPPFSGLSNIVMTQSLQ